MADWKKGMVGIRNGRLINILEPNPDDIRIEDIAHSLANQCRFGGHTRRFYSVSEHSINVASLLGENLKLYGLLHDASEAYLTDIVTPVKRMLPEYMRIEANLQAVIFQKFGLGVTAPPDVHTADQVMLATEISDYVGADPVYWGVTATPLSKRLRMPMKPLDAMNAFLDLFHELTGDQ